MAEEETETWAEMADRIESEEADAKYSKQLFSSYNTFMKAGFTRRQAWALVKEEHFHRLQYMADMALAHFQHRLDGGADG